MEIKTAYTIKGGLYLVVDPSIGWDALKPKVESAIKGGVAVLQIWNHWNTDQDKTLFIQNICALAHAHNVPVLINEEWSWLMHTPLDGVHFDHVPKNLNFITQFINKPFLKGITCGNDTTRIQWAIHHQVDYISFCSMFPSSSTDVCELVSPEVVKQTRQKTTMPIFAAGGITVEKIPELLKLGVDGVAVISAITKAENAESKSREFYKALHATKS